MRYKRPVISQVSILFCVLFLLYGCKGGSNSPAPAPSPPTPATRNVNISWTANNESRVNTTNGGYRVYISTTSGFNITDTGVTTTNVPYVSGSLAPTTATVILNSGATYYIRVVAYSAFPVANTTSSASAQTSLTLP